MIHTEHLRKLIIQPALKKMNLYSLNAEYLLLGIAAHESKMGTYLRQFSENPSKPDGVALGIYQMEADTYYDIWDNVLKHHKHWRNRLMRHCLYSEEPLADRLISDNLLSTIMCRLQFARYPEPIPEIQDDAGMANYWKKYYNRSESHNEDAFSNAYVMQVVIGQQRK